MRFAVRIGLFAAAVGCGQASVQVLTPDGTGTGPAVPTWRADVIPALSVCGSGTCHAGAPPSGELPLSPDLFVGDDPSALLAYILNTGGLAQQQGLALEIDTSNADASLILCHAVNACPSVHPTHDGGNAWGSAGSKRYKKVRAWIASGAPDN